MLKQPTISVVIPNYNNAQFLTECIDSVFAQTYQPLECIVVDDGSTDNSLELLNDLAQMYSNLRIFEQINSGPSVARNFGMKHAKGEYIAILDADDYWSARKLENQVRVVNEINNDKHIITSHNNYLNANGEFTEIKNAKLPPYSIFDALTKNVAIGSCSSVLFPKSLIIETSGYNPILRSSEDQDFHFRAILNQYQFYHSAPIDVHIRWHENNSTKSIINNIYFHFLALEVQIEILEGMNIMVTSKQEYLKALIGRLGTIAFWAKEANRKDILFFARTMLQRKIGKKKYYTMLTTNALSKIKNRFVHQNISLG